MIESSDEYLKEKLTSHTWEKYSDQIKAYLRYEFNDDGTYTYTKEHTVEIKNGKQIKSSAGTWSVRDSVLFVKSKSIYASGETEEYTFTELDKDEAENENTTLGNDEFYVSDECLILGNSRYTIYEN